MNARTILSLVLGLLLVAQQGRARNAGTDDRNDEPDYRIVHNYKMNDFIDRYMTDYPQIKSSYKRMHGMGGIRNDDLGRRNGDTDEMNDFLDAIRDVQGDGLFQSLKQTAGRQSKVYRNDDSEVRCPALGHELDDPYRYDSRAAAAAAASRSAAAAAAARSAAAAARSAAVAAAARSAAAAAAARSAAIALASRSDNSAVDNNSNEHSRDDNSSREDYNRDDNGQDDKSARNNIVDHLKKVNGSINKDEFKALTNHVRRAAAAAAASG